MDPPLTEQERGFVRTIQRLGAVLAGKDAKPPLAEKDLAPRSAISCKGPADSAAAATGMALMSTLPPEPRETAHR